MTSPADRIDAALSDLFDQRDSLAEKQAELSRRRVTVRSANRLLSVSVDARGAVQNVTFHSTAYTRMTPDDLGRVITDTAGEAQAEMARGIAEQLAPMRAATRAVRDSLTGGLGRPAGQDTPRSTSSG